MEAFGVLKFWWTFAAGPPEDSFFDLVLTSPVRRAGFDADKDFQLIQSAGDADSNPLYPVTLLRSTTKFKIFMLGFRKSPNCAKTESNGEIRGTPMNQFSKSSQIQERNRLSVTCRASACSLAGDNSLRSQLLRETSDDKTWTGNLTKGCVRKYLRLIKPLSLMIRKRNEKTKLTTPSASPATAPVHSSPRKSSESSRMGSFKISSKRLRKSRSASAAVGVAAPPVQRRDDSLLERHDGIQSAVLYCKRSYNSSSKELFEISSCEEPKRCSI